MPSRNALKQFIPESSYHCYNRGVEKRRIFMDRQDYGVFLNRLKQMLSDPDEIKGEYSNRELVKSFYGRIELYAYCLMPNHYHLLLYQYDDTAISEFMRTLGTSYTMYFNKRHERVGHLFQGRYKARPIQTDADAMHISRYIHLNPIKYPDGYELYPYSSMQYVLFTERCPSWVATERALKSYWDSRETYSKFVKDFATEDSYEELDDLYSLD